MAYFFKDVERNNIIKKHKDKTITLNKEIIIKVLVYLLKIE